MNSWFFVLVNSSIVFNDSFSVESPVPCWKLQAVGYVCIVLFVLSLISNGLLLRMFISDKKSRNKMNTYAITLTIINIVAATIEWPTIILSNFYCK